MTPPFTPESPLSTTSDSAFPDEHAYQAYLIGCQRMSIQPVDRAEFTRRWAEFELHAENLKQAEAGGNLLDVPAARRAEMQSKFQQDPFVQALLLGLNQMQ